MRTPEAFAERMKGRIDKGFSFLKMDFGVDMIKDEPGTIVGKNLWDPALRQWEGTPGSYGMTRPPFTRIQITDRGLARITDFLAAVREHLRPGTEFMTPLRSGTRPAPGTAPGADTRQTDIPRRNDRRRERWPVKILASVAASMVWWER